MTKIQQQEIFNDLKQYAYILRRDRYRTFELEEIESEIMFWASGRLEHLWNAKQQNELSYRKYLKVSILNLLNRMIIPIQVKHAMEYRFTDDEPLYSNNIITPSEADRRLKAHDVSIFERLRAVVSQKRYEICVEYYVNGKSRAEIAKCRNVSEPAISQHISSAINLLVITQ